MKKMFRILMTLVMAVFMTASLISPVFAEGDDDTTPVLPTSSDGGKITVTNLDSEISTVTAYKLLKANYSTEGNGFTGYSLSDELANYIKTLEDDDELKDLTVEDLISGHYSYDKDGNKVIEYSNTASHLADVLTELANRIETGKLTTLQRWTKSAETEGDFTSKDTDDGVIVSTTFGTDDDPMKVGEYLILAKSNDKDTIYNPMVASIFYTVSGTDNTTNIPVKISAGEEFEINDSKVYMKKTTNEFDKKIVDPKDGYLGDGTTKTDGTLNTTSDGTTDYGDDVAIGDLVEFRITAGIPNYSDEYIDLKYHITDELEKGLTLQTGTDTDSSGTILAKEMYEDKKLVDATEKGRPTVKITVSKGEHVDVFYWSDYAARVSLEYDEDAEYIETVTYNENGSVLSSDISLAVLAEAQQDAKEANEAAGYTKVKVIQVFATGTTTGGDEYKAFYADEKGFEFNFSDEYIRAHSQYNVEVSYKAQLNENADVNLNPNENKATLDFTTNPNGDTSSTVKKTYTYTFEINGFVDGLEGSGDQSRNREVLKVESAEKTKILNEGYYRFYNEDEFAAALKHDSIMPKGKAMYHVHDGKLYLYEPGKNPTDANDSESIAAAETEISETTLNAGWYININLPSYHVHDGKVYSVNAETYKETEETTLSADGLADGWYESLPESTSDRNYIYHTASYDRHDHSEADAYTDAYQYYYYADYFVTVEGENGIISKIVTEDVAENEQKMTAKNLEGAVFTMYTDESCADGTELKRSSTDQDGTDTTDKVVTAVSDSSGRLIGFRGLDADQYAGTDDEGHVVYTGRYWFKETEAPKGYTVSEEVHWVDIVAAYNTDGTLAGYTITIDDKATSTYEAHYGEPDVDEDTGETTVNIDNIKDLISNEAFLINNTTMPELPSTGGIGTYIFTIGGVAIMAAAILMFLMDRRRSSQS